VLRERRAGPAVFHLPSEALFRILPPGAEFAGLIVVTGFPFRFHTQQTGRPGYFRRCFLQVFQMSIAA
jgi:hypothetical protein